MKYLKKTWGICTRQAYVKNAPIRVYSFYVGMPASLSRIHVDWILVSKVELK